MIYIRDDLKALFANEQSVSDFAAIEGEVFKKMPGRHTLRFERDQRGFFIKYHSGVGWAEIFKNLLSFRLPVVSARNEWQAIKALERLGVTTMTLAAYGTEGHNPARLRSFVITESIEGSEHLVQWLPRLQDIVDTAQRFRLKRAIIKKVAEIARRIHTNGINHRDFYLYHLRLADAEAVPLVDPDNLTVYLMDLHRVQIRAVAPSRWVVKDIAGLLYSTLYQVPEFTLSRTDALYFMRHYQAKPWRDSLRDDSRFWHQVIARTVKMARKTHGNGTDMPAILLHH